MLRYQCNAIFQDSMCWVNTILPSSPFCPLSNSGANSNHGAKRVHQRGISALSVQISNNRYFCESHLFSAFAQQFGEQIFLPLHPVFQVLKPTLARHQRLVQKVHYQVARFYHQLQYHPPYDMGKRQSSGSPSQKELLMSPQSSQWSTTDHPSVKQTMNTGEVGWMSHCGCCIGIFIAYFEGRYYRRIVHC